MKAVEMEVNKRLEVYLGAFIHHNYENGAKQVQPDFVPPSAEEIQKHIQDYIRLNPFTLEEKVVEKKRMGRPKKNEIETMLSVDNELGLQVTNMRIDESDDESGDVGKKEKVEKAPKVKKEKAEKVKKEKAEKVKKEKAEKPPKEPKVKAEKVKKEKAEKPPKEPKVKAEKVKKEKAPKEEGEAKKRGRPKKSDEDKKEESTQESVEEVQEQLKQQLEVLEQSIKDAELAVDAEVEQVLQAQAQQQQQQQQEQAASGNNDEVTFEDYDGSPKQAEDRVPFTDKTTGKDCYIDKSMKVENEDDDSQVWYAVKEAATGKIIGRSNLLIFQGYAEDSDEDEEEEEEEEEEDADEDADEDDEDD